MSDLEQELLDIAQHNFEACCRLDKRLGKNYSAYRYAERRIKELEKCGEHRQDIIEILEGRVEGLEAENQRLLRHLNRMNDIMCDALASTALLGGGE